MHPLTDDRWHGLRLARCERSGREQRLDITTEESVLLLHESGSTGIEVRRHPFAWRFTAAPGSFDFYPAGHYDAYLCGPAATTALVLFIPARFEREVLEERRQHDPLAPRFQFRDKRLDRLVLALAQRAAGGTVDDEVALSLAIVDRLHETMAQPHREDAHATFSPMLRRLVAEHLEAQIGGPLDLEGVARLSGLRRTQFSEAFREAFGQSLQQYVLALRIANAKERLLLKQVSLAEVAHELGFASHAHFTTVFKSRVGVTPSQFRDEHGVSLRP